MLRCCCGVNRRPAATSVTHGDGPRRPPGGMSLTHNRHSHNGVRKSGKPCGGDDLNFESRTDLPNDFGRRECGIDHEGIGRLFQDGELALQEFLTHEMIDAIGYTLTK